MNIQLATQQYDDWLRSVCTVYEPDIDEKHRIMAKKDPFPFFRATYYRWLQRWPEVCAHLQDAPDVLAIGDLHVENFGTWRDADGRLVWGINDLDEASTMPYANDLLRLAASAWFAKQSDAFDVKFANLCQWIVAGYRQGLETPEPFVLEERHSELRAIAMSKVRNPVDFWSKTSAVLTQPATEPPADAKAKLIESLPSEGLSIQYRFRSRVGAGSLGKPRFVAIAEWAGGWVARECKAKTPPSAAWAFDNRDLVSRVEELNAIAIRCTDPYFQADGNWTVRRLSPQCSRIELDQIADAAGMQTLFQSMGAETANIHLGSSEVKDAILVDLNSRPADWLETSARDMAKAIRKDWSEWRSTYDG